MAAPNESSLKESGEDVEPKSHISPISMPDKYEDLIANSNREPEISFPKVHQVFKNEPRDETWAAAMEAGIGDSIANFDSEGWAVVEYVECRSRICEIAGYSTDGEGNRYTGLVGGFLKSGLWQGNHMTHQTAFARSDSDRKYFILAISGYSASEYLSIFPSL